MNALAQVLRARGYAVSGSDRSLDRGLRLPIWCQLRRAGVELLPQDGRGAAAAGLVAVSTAIEPDNPDLRAANRARVPVIHRAALLARLARGRRVVAVTGTAGKTTVTGLVGWILDRAGRDPLVVNGAPVINWRRPGIPGNVRVGHGRTWVLEVDESDRSLLRFRPDWAVITNISKDHFETDEAARLFRRFARRVRRGLVGVYGQPPWPPPDFRPRLTAAGSVFNYQGTRFTVPLPGRHNAENALQSVMLCERLGVKLETARWALRSFRGIERRLELAGRAGGIRIIDDYAHNPAKIAAACRTVAAGCRRLLAVWRPHGFAPLALMLPELSAALAGVLRPADRVFILPVYYAGGTVRRLATAGDLAARLRRAGARAAAPRGYGDLRRRLRRLARPGDAILFMGARDPGLPVFVRRCVSDLRPRCAADAR